MSKPGPSQPSRYELRVDGHLGDHWASWLGGMSLVHEDDGTTTLRGTVDDQPELYGLLGKVRDLGATLLSVAPLPDGRAPEPGCEMRSGAHLDRITWPVHTDRLVVRPAIPSDADATWEFRRLADVSRWLTRAPATLLEHRRYFEEATSLAKTLVVEHDGRVVGDLMLQVEDAWAQAEVTQQARGAQAELGWALHPDHTGRGLATEAVRELVRRCFDDLGLRRVTATCFAANDASWRLMERLGMRRELHAARESLHRSGQWLDVVGYALLAEEWRSPGAAGAAAAR